MSKKMPDVTMDEAIFTCPESGAMQIVQAKITDEALKPGNVYYDKAEHYGSLSCRYCEATVTHVKEKPSIAGDNLGGGSAHFRTLSDHSSECEWEIKAHARSKSKIDKEKGYKFHWNNAVRPGRSKRGPGQIYVRDENHKIQTTVRDLVDRESISFETVSDLIERIKAVDLQRLNSSVIVRHNHIVPWDEFLIRYQRRSDNDNRFATLVNNISNKGSQPALIEIFNDSAIGPCNKTPSGSLCAKSREVFLYNDGRGKAHYLTPRVWLDSAEVESSMNECGSYLVLGEARLSKHSRIRPNRVDHFVDISVTSENQICRTRLKDVAAHMTIKGP